MVTRPNSTPIVLLYGQSGVGKSSILAAGLIPRLEESHEVCYVRRNEEIGLLASVKQALASEEDYDFGRSVHEASIHFEDDWVDLEQQSSKPLVLIVDQLEECFTRPNPKLTQNRLDFVQKLIQFLG